MELLNVLFVMPANAVVFITIMLQTILLYFNIFYYTWLYKQETNEQMRVNTQIEWNKDIIIHGCS